ncbi:arginine repressor, ArgR [Thermincola potens JR]|uniref:Arginine repressor n=2 Tax=Thermincola TaxID=278993 RepID=D5X7H1_THEPJ|nr:arginine repressor, ArgR [Thermincola potens JR]
MMKSKRHLKILEIVNSKIIETQEELAEELKRAGFDVTQATVSRDIKELRLVKIPIGDNHYRYGVPTATINLHNQERMKTMFRDSVVKLDYSENIIVVKTLPGTAQAVASTIDGANDPHIIGTVAGDDTILVVVKPIQALLSVFNKFTALTQRRG